MTTLIKEKLNESINTCCRPFRMDIAQSAARAK